MKRTLRFHPVAVLIALVCGSAMAADTPWIAADQPDLVAKMQTAPELKAVEVCQPARGVASPTNEWVPNPDGKTYDVLTWYCKQVYDTGVYPMVLDLSSGEAKVLPYPENRTLTPGYTGWIIGPDRKMYFSTTSRRSPTLCGTAVFVYDPAKNELEDRGVLVEDLKGEGHPMCVSPDGQIFGSGNNFENHRPGLFQIDPPTKKFTFLGYVETSWATAHVWTQSLAADEKFIYAAYGKEPWRLIAVDRKTRKSEVLLTTNMTPGNMPMEVIQRRNGVEGFAMSLVGADGKPVADGKRVDFWLVDGKVVMKKDPKEAPPWQEPAGTKPWVVFPPRPESYVEDLGDGKEAFWYTTTPAPAKGEERKTPAEWRKISYEKKVWPQNLGLVTTLPDGRIFGVVSNYLGNFVYDPKTGKGEHLGATPLSYYTMTVSGGKVYMSGYPSSLTLVYDPAKPWTAGRKKPDGKGFYSIYNDGDCNPMSFGWLRLFSGTHCSKASAAAGDGRLFFGGEWRRDGEFGGIYWIDPKGKAEDFALLRDLCGRALRENVTAEEKARVKCAGGFWDTFSNYRIDDGNMAATGDGRFIVISTEPANDSKLGKPTPKQGRIFVFAVVANKITQQFDPVPGAQNCGQLATAPGARVVGVLPRGNSTLNYGIDSGQGKVVVQREVPFKQSRNLLVGPDGWIWTYLDTALVRINPADLTIQPIGHMSERNQFAFSGGDLYYAWALR